MLYSAGYSRTEEPSWQKTGSPRYQAGKCVDQSSRRSKAGRFWDIIYFRGEGSIVQNFLWNVCLWDMFVERILCETYTLWNVYFVERILYGICLWSVYFVERVLCGNMFVERILCETYVVG